MRRIILLVLGFIMLGTLPGVRAAARRDLQGVQVVVDPGHGGYDLGVDPAGSGLTEKDLALDLGQRLRRGLEARGAQVYITRTSDRFVSLNARVRFANAILFRPDNDLARGRLLSVHLNSNLRQPTLTRVEVFVDPEAAVPPLAIAMANALEQVTDGGFGYRDAGYPPGVHPGDLAPIRWTYPRGHNVLTEAVFLSNPEHALLLRDSSFLDRLAAAHITALEETLAALR